MIVKPAERLAEVSEYYFSRKLQEVRALAAAGRDIINLGIGSPDLPPAEPVIRQLISAAGKPGVHGYQPYRGIPELRQAMSDYYLRLYGVSLDPAGEILPLMGSKEGILHISLAFVNPGDEVLVPDPGYPGYAGATRIAGGILRSYDLQEQNGWLPDLDALAARDLSRVKLMWINYPHMPTGAMAGSEAMARMVDFARSHGILLINDNPYSRILNPDPVSLLSIPGAMDCCLELNSLSKSHHMPGWRVGLLAGRADYIDTVLKVKSNMDSGMFRPLQEAAAAALATRDDWHEAQNAIYAQRRKQILGMVEPLGFSASPNAAGLFVWARAPRHIPDVEKFVDEILHTLGVFMAPGMVFGENGRPYLRLSLCASDHNIKQAVERIQSYQQVAS
ncbi:MAG TPA: aminotransferase class I/II-fold pyridoxal phosphate-dependent enzyme [Calditrichia bacterium]|nr:aminotransferase class I/II-fold pyridoxal phosphate-dependent enzyme [Calditrichia bacterium]